MTFLRRHLASSALAVMLLQVALLGAAPLAACCAPDGGRTAAPRPSDQTECCPPGSHPPGQCPLHRDRRGNSRPAAAECRMQCDAPTGSGILLGSIGLLPPPAIATVSPVSQALSPASEPLPANRPALPDAPPPKAL